MVIRGDDGFVQNSNKVEDEDELKEEIKRANQFRIEEGYDEFYFIRGSSGGRQVEMDDNNYGGNQDLEEVAHYKVSDEGFENIS